MRHNRSQSAQRRSHHGLKAATLSTCSHCGAQHRPHHMCLACGYYNGRQVMDLESDKAKRDARMQAKKERISAEAGTLAPEKNEVVEENVKVEKPKKIKEAKKEVEKGAM